MTFSTQYFVEGCHKNLIFFFYCAFILSFFLTYSGDKLQIDRKPCFLHGCSIVSLCGLSSFPHFEDVLVEDESVIAPFGQKVTGDLHGVLKIINLTDVETIKACNHQALKLH